MPDPINTRKDPTETIREHRPVLLTLVFWVFLLWIVLGWMRFTAVLADWSSIAEIFPGWLTWYLLIAGLIWGLTGLPVLWGIVRRAYWALPLIWLAGFLYPAVYWIERLLLWRDPNAQGNWPFMFVLTLLWFGLVLWVQHSQRVRDYFAGSNGKGS